MLILPFLLYLFLFFPKILFTMANEEEENRKIPKSKKRDNETEAPFLIGRSKPGIQGIVHLCGKFESSNLKIYCMILVIVIIEQ